MVVEFWKYDQEPVFHSLPLEGDLVSIVSSSYFNVAGVQLKALVILYKSSFFSILSENYSIEA